MEAWGNPVTVPVQGAADGDLQQLYPAWMAPGSGSSAMGTLRRTPAQGTLYRLEVNPIDGEGGYVEIWDIAGLQEGGTDNVDTGVAITDAYLQAQIAVNRARMIWRVDFKGDPGLTSKVWTTRVPFTRGLACRYVNTSLVTGAKNITLAIVADGGYHKVSIVG